MKLPLWLARRPSRATGRHPISSLILLFCSALLFSRLAADSPPPAPAGDAGIHAPTDSAAYVKAQQSSPGHLVGNDLINRILQLWSDEPAYVRFFNDKTHAKKAARVQSTVAPVPPLVPAIPGKENVTVAVSFIVDETGGVEAARVLESSDPRFNQPAIDAVLQWRFFPAEGEQGFMKSSFVVPIKFAGQQAEDLAIRLADSRPSRVVNSGIDLRPQQTPPPPPTLEWAFDVQLQGPGAADVKAGRIIISHATDDTGAELQSAQKPTFYHPAVGSISSDDLVRTPFPPLNFSVGGVNPTAKKILAVEGVIELVIPRLDPTGAKAVIENVPAKIGSPVTSDALSAAGITLVMYDKLTCDRYRADKNAAGGPKDYDSGDLFGVRPSWMPAPRSNLKVSERDLAIGISDPQGKLIGLEFQTADGKPLRYDHNGWYHSADTDPPTKRFDVYNLGNIPADAKLVCWLITPRSLFKMPL
jgi:TonB family protein